VSGWRLLIFYFEGIAPVIDWGFFFAPKGDCTMRDWIIPGDTDCDLKLGEAVDKIFDRDTNNLGGKF